VHIQCICDGHVTDIWLVLLRQATVSSLSVDSVHIQCICDGHVTDIWLVLLRQATVRCLSVDSVHIQCDCDVNISLSAYIAQERIR
jgi:hypothetical protein